jgi:hypothetical protein
MNGARSRRARLAAVCGAALAALTLATADAARHHCSFWAAR